MQEKRTEIAKYQGVVHTIPSHRQLMKINKLLMGAVIFLMLLVFLLGVFFVPSPDIVADYNKIYAVNMAAQGMNPMVSDEVNTLKGQLIGIVSGSIESKLSSLEKSIKSGTPNNSLGTIEDLKKDVKVLRAYSESPAEKSESAEVSNAQLAEEVTQLKHLIFMTIASCGLMFAAAVGIWIKYRKRLPYKEIQGFLGKR